ncbi:NifB/NifX family molybdenum-iron cluster-binding protein [Desulfococcaceae bacterium HSG8]|nr:NifB/NifX family molybdenum-iron cluster-binding protein [Desulfococcaceae bacterium HSG8]
MKLAITSDGTTLSSETDPRFGRAAYFILADPDTLEYEVIENRQNINLPQGAGIQAARTIVNACADALITGNCGPKAFTVLQKAGIEVLPGAKGKVEDVIEQYKKGAFTPAKSANVDGHWV